MPNLSRLPVSGGIWVFWEVSPVCHINLKTDRTDYRKPSWKTISRQVDPVQCYWLLYYRIWEILSNVLVAVERSLSFIYGRPEKSCSSFSFKLMYFGKRKASQIKFFWSRSILLMIVSNIVMVERESFWLDILFVNLYYGGRAGSLFVVGYKS